jgi:hypothetical protein
MPCDTFNPYTATRGVLYDRSNNLVDTTAKAAVPFWLDKKPRLDGSSLQGVEGSPGNDSVVLGPQPAIGGEGRAVDGRSEDEVYYGRIGELGLPLDELDALRLCSLSGNKFTIVVAYKEPQPILHML